MLFFDGGFGLLMLGLWLFCIIDVITTDSALCRNLPKMAWLLIVLLLPDIGSIAWLIAGHTWDRQGGRNLPYKGNHGRFPEYNRPGRQAAGNPDDDEQFLLGLRQRAEQQRLEYQARRAREIEAEEEQKRIDKLLRDQRRSDGTA
jgi:hypothetical protein